MKKLLPSFVIPLAILLLLSVSAFATEITRGPMLQQPETESMLVVFDLDFPAVAELKLGDCGSVPDRSIVADSARTDHHIIMDGLLPGQCYSYIVEVGGETLSGPHEFNSAPLPDSPFNFGLLGDTRSGHDKHQALMDMMAQEDFDFYVNSGDLVSDGEVVSDWIAFFDIESENLASHAMFPAIGNHDEEDGRATSYLNHFDIDKSSSGKEEYYSFDYGNVHFTVLDGHVNITPQWLCAQILFMSDCFTVDQMNWISQDLAAANNNPDIDHIVVMTHMGPYSSKENRSGSAQIRSLMQTFTENGVDLILSGHDHYYERGISSTGIPYVVSGGGGAGLYAPDQDNSWLYPHTIQKKAAIHHYGIAKVTGPLMEFTITDIEGNELDRFEIGARPACTDSTVIADCGPDLVGGCRGHWECPNFECVWTCDPDSCTEAEDCADLEAPPECPEGHWECTPDNICQWYCPPSVECESDEDCAGKEPYDDCAGGYYICEDAVCDWVCPGAVDGDDEPVTDGDDNVPSTDGDAFENVEEDRHEPEVEDGDTADYLCRPGTLSCEGNKLMVCAADAKSLQLQEDCSPGDCLGDRCVEAAGKPENPADGVAGAPTRNGSGGGCRQQENRNAWSLSALLLLALLCFRRRHKTSE